MSIVTTGQYDESKWEVKSMVAATHTESVSLFRGLIAGIGGIIGGPSETMNKKMNDIMGKLISKLQSQIGTDEMVVGTQFQFSEFGREQSNTFISGVVTGTLLKKKAQTGGFSRKNRTYRKKRIA